MDGSGIAIVTGGSRGIGRAAAVGLAEQGFTVAIVGQDASRVASAVEEMVGAGHDVIGQVCDVTDPPDVALLGAEIAAVGPVELVVNSAGVMSDRMAKTLRASPEEWRRVIDVNLFGAIHLIGQFGPAMVERRRGRVVNVSACLGRFTGPGLAGGLAPYRVSKAALNALTLNFAAETGFGRRGVLVDAMCPAHCRTDMGGPDAPRSAEQGADTIVWLATRDAVGAQTGRLWEDRQPIPW
ncbi:MAG: SDR family NAD(P)-dependent oxidoreductase [Actinomycetia bacterium]|nr:SDR family NAD(P)-dependent oxidoreductase [Actinomycetes bacterium]